MITLEQAKALQVGDVLHHVFALNADGTPERWRVNGKSKTWKRSPERVQVPLKRGGLYEYDYLDENNLDQFDLAHSRQMKLEAVGTPWARVYRGSGRPDGTLSKLPVFMDNGDVAPGWVSVGSMTVDEFYAWVAAEEHINCHSSTRPESFCRHCRELGWVDGR